MLTPNRDPNNENYKFFLTWRERILFLDLLNVIKNPGDRLLPQNDYYYRGFNITISPGFKDLVSDLNDYMVQFTNIEDLRGYILKLKDKIQLSDLDLTELKVGITQIINILTEQDRQELLTAMQSLWNSQTYSIRPQDINYALEAWYQAYLKK